jgi:hypothetical protein
MKNILGVAILLLFIVGCSAKNSAYKDFEKSPCACYKDKVSKKVVSNG